MSTLTLKKFTLMSFGGINKENPIVIEFPATKGKRKKIGIHSGDQATRKTSTINGLLYACAEEFDFNLGNLVNLQDNSLAGEFDFDAGGNQYKVKFTKSKFELFSYYSNGKEGRFIPESNPKTMLKKLIGHVATSPMKLKEMKGKAQIEWLFEMLNISDETKVEQLRIETALEKATKSRTAAHNEYIRIKGNLEDNKMYKDYEGCATKYAEVKTIASVQQKYQAHKVKKENYDKAQSGVNDIASDIVKKNTEIEDLEAKLKKATQELTALKEREKKGNEYLKSNKNVPDEYAKVEGEFMTISQYLIEQADWLRVKEEKQQLDEYETLVQRCDTAKDDLRSELRKLIKSITPDIPGLEVVIETPIDGTKKNTETGEKKVDKPLGFYLYDKTPAQLCESELFDFYLKLCEINGVRMAVIENISVLGSKAVETINKMAKNGIYIWGTEMERGQNYAKIEFIEEYK